MPFLFNNDNVSLYTLTYFLILFYDSEEVPKIGCMQ